MIDRERSFDMSKLSDQEADILAKQIGDKVRGMVDETANKINELLTIYGMKAKFKCVIVESKKVKVLGKTKSKQSLAQEG